MNDLPSDARAKLLRAYVESLPRKRARIEECWVRVQATDFSSAAMAELRTLAHRLAGSAGSYGFEALGETAAALDEALDSEAPGATQRQLVGSRTADLLESLSAASKEKPDPAFG